MRRKLFALMMGVAFVGIVGCMQPEDKYEADFKSTNIETRKEAATQLGEMGTNRALQLLQLHEDDPDFTVRDSVRAAIKKINKQTFMK
ncbi:MAG: HEAT repeat domain-containing protein [Candidatus Ozemobacteraceae bacterium]